MRFIDIEEIKPAIRDKIEALEDARAKVLAESDPDLRAALIDRRMISGPSTTGASHTAWTSSVCGRVEVAKSIRRDNRRAPPPVQPPRPAYPGIVRAYCLRMSAGDSCPSRSLMTFASTPV